MDTGVLHKIEDLAVDVMKYIPRENLISSGAYIGMALCYQELVKKGEIGRLADLSEGEKRKYWNETGGVPKQTFRSERPIKRMWACQALYLYDLITGGTPP